MLLCMGQFRARHRHCLHLDGLFAITGLLRFFRERQIAAAIDDTTHQTDPELLAASSIRSRRAGSIPLHHF
jgi:hypothetical protein